MEMNNSLQKYARIAGLTYILVILIGSVSVSYIDTILFMPGDSTATVSNILSNESPYRLAVLGELIMFVLVVVLFMGTLPRA
jgi:translation elongation factor EF-1alpha